MNLRPLQDCIIIKRLPADSKTASGIVIVSNESEQPDQGEVVAIGSGRILENGETFPLTVKIGDHVLFGRHTGQTIKIMNEEFLVMREEHILGVFDDEYF